MKHNYNKENTWQSNIYHHQEKLAKVSRTENGFYDLTVIYV